MNMHTKLIVTALGFCALPFAQASEFADYGRVIRVQPRVEQIRQPREECKTEYVQVPVQQQPQQRSAGGAIIGGIAGALLGNQVGGGSGRAAATAAGAIAGAVVGDRVDNNGRPVQAQQQYMQEQAVRQCRMVDAYESRTMGYDVTYDYRGQTYTSLMDRDPGQRIRLRVSVEPERGQ
ncbi:glycine zipper 2TM domain-containing protein [Massilia genomosp. 1]|uniref:Glycine zipper 2TM domain-containing protein n=1 Tax=Massilia genomosp. 1 TaxID=2609280 RepID=A0ABX0MKG7_9BURK|nr:glycine zipper 2TM domain-containing protein [Massilia genomosp. 1]NHZ61090.1 glycine zipper 2TM domain-containing protein [Massilia genomosp. 1]